MVVLKTTRLVTPEDLEEVPEVRVLTQEAVNERIRFYRSPHTTARGIDSAGTRDGDKTASEPLPKGRLQCHFGCS